MNWQLIHGEKSSTFCNVDEDADSVYIFTVFFISCRYLQQFQDLYTEEGRKFVKISSYIPTKQAMIQAQIKNKVKAEPNRTPSPCQGPDNKTNGGAVKTQSHPNSGNKVAVNTVVKNDGSNVTNQSIAGKIPIYNTSSLAGTTSGVVMTGANSNLAGVAVQGILLLHIEPHICTICDMSGCVVSRIQTGAKSESDSVYLIQHGCETISLA